jgi:glycosyltransferase involved in cell wall biosynthesis
LHRRMKRKDRMPEISHSDRPGALPARALAYLMSTYPTLSMTFVLREVLALRELGFRVETASINPPDRPANWLTPIEVDEAKRTYYVKQHGLSGATVAKLQTVLGNFRGYWRGVALAFRLAGLDLRRLYLNLMYFIEALMVGQWMKRKGLRHLHVHLASQAASVGLFVRTVFGFGYSLTVHGPDEFYDAERQMLAEKIRAADFLCCISSFTRSQLMMQSPYEHWSKFVVLPLGVDPEIFAPRPERAAQEFFENRPAPETFEILCVGRLIPAKGQHILIDAVERLTQVDRLTREGRRVRLRLVGSGPDEISLREHVARSTAGGCVVFEGAINQDHIRGFYAAADAFCLPSFAEGLPVVLMEAMAMEVPCVTTHIAGIPELIRNGVDGILVPPSDLDALVKALARVMDDAELRQRMGRSGRARVVEHYDLRRNVERLAAIFVERV